MLKPTLVALALAASTAAFAWPGGTMTRPETQTGPVRVGEPERRPEERRPEAPQDPEERRPQAPRAPEAPHPEDAPTSAKGPPSGTMGAFVQARHAEGLRGRALAEAIHAEHARRGRGPNR